MKSMKFVLAAAAASVALSTGVPRPAVAGDHCEGRDQHFIYYATHAIPEAVWETVRRGAVQGAKDNCLRLKWTQDQIFSVETTINRMEAAVAENPDVLVITRDRSGGDASHGREGARRRHLRHRHQHRRPGTEERTAALCHLHRRRPLSERRGGGEPRARRAPRRQAGRVLPQRARPCGTRRDVPRLPGDHGGRFRRAGRGDPDLAGCQRHRGHGVPTISRAIPTPTPCSP